MTLGEEISKWFINNKSKKNYKISDGFKLVGIKLQVLVHFNRRRKNNPSTK